MNSVNMVGRLTADLELKTKGQNSYCQFSIAVDRGVSKEKITDFFNCVAFNKTAEILSQYVKKGDQIAISGRMETSKKDKITYYNINVGSVTLLSQGKNNSSQPKDHDEPRNTQRSKQEDIQGPDDLDDDYPF